MKIHGLILVAVSATIIGLSSAVEVDLNKVYETAETQLNHELWNKIEAGARSSRFNRKKFTA